MHDLHDHLLRVGVPHVPSIEDLVCASFLTQSSSSRPLLSPRKSPRRLLTTLPDRPALAPPRDSGDASEEDREGEKAVDAFGPALAGRLTRLPPK
jgi:hypothetical protein